MTKEKREWLHFRCEWHIFYHRSERSVLFYWQANCLSQKSHILLPKEPKVTIRNVFCAIRDMIRNKKRNGV